ncbi:MAG: FkbM family methyltransferase [Hyphomicrobiaceae bacterium]
MSTTMTRMTFGGLDLAVIDPHERDTDYIYDEIFTRRIYAHSKFRIPSGGTILDVGGNIGLYSIWAAREYKPSAIYSYEASPVTYRYLVDNVGRHVDKAVTAVHCVNRAVSRRADVELVLRQAPLVSGISTMLDPSQVPWVRDLEAAGHLVSHTTLTTTVSAELARHAIARVDLLKIDVEGHFMEVLGGISDADFGRIANIVLEADYLEALELIEAQVCAFLEARGYTTEASELTIYAWR